MFKTKKAAYKVAKISNRNNKMPGSTFPQDSFACSVGSRLAQVKGSICHGCYARRIQKMRPNVAASWKWNLESARHWLKVNPDQWIQACVFQIKRMADKSGERFHRWFDSGDLDSVEQLKAIVRVVESTPDIRHWLPTREIGLYSEYIRAGGSIPSNLVVRISSPMIDDKPLSWEHTSTVHKDKAPYGYPCPAYTQGGSCGDCRACWDKRVPNISYPKH